MQKFLTQKKKTLYISKLDIHSNYISMHAVVNYIRTASNITSADLIKKAILKHVVTTGKDSRKGKIRSLHWYSPSGHKFSYYLKEDLTKEFTSIIEKSIRGIEEPYANKKVYHLKPKKITNAIIDNKEQILIHLANKTDHEVVNLSEIIRIIGYSRGASVDLAKFIWKSDLKGLGINPNVEMIASKSGKAILAMTFRSFFKLIDYWEEGRRIHEQAQE